ncbi:MAG: dihydroorotase [Desulfobulbus propionicus]|nr:MAG: dihydroorotase [Desulfobulbus propionicus]
MNTSWRIINGRIIDPVNAIDREGEIFVHNGVIVSSSAALSPEARIIDAAGCLVVPGLIDMHVHLREPGQEYKEDILSGTLSAASGGFTAVACMPNTVPVIDNSAVCTLVKERSRNASARVYPIGAISTGNKGEKLAEFGDLRDAGAVGVSDDGLPVRDSQLMRRALEYASNFGLAVISHSEEPALAQGVMNEGFVSTRLGLKGIPDVAESIMIYRDIALAEFTGKRVHIAHVSTEKSVDLIRQAKTRGVPVTAETAPHFFTLTHEDIGEYDTNFKMNPPLRSEKDRLAIIKALQDGTIDAIATDHAPHSSLEKEIEFAAAAFGIIGLETAVPLTLDLVRQGLLDELKMVELMSVNPARILGVEGGHLSPGKPADITLINCEEKFIYSIDKIVSRSKNSPFIDRTLQGRAVLTMMAGKVTHTSFQER